MNLVGELVLARNQILQYSQHTATRASGHLPAAQPDHHRAAGRRHEDPDAADRQRLEQASRVVRDAAQACGKQVRLDMEGSDTELDKTIIEAIRDPLTHLVRNAVDHGIEPPDRAPRGQAGRGLRRLRAYHEGGRSTSRSATTAAASTPSASSTRPSSAA